MNLHRSIPALLVAVLAASALAACGASSTTPTRTQPSATGTATTPASSPTTSTTAAGQAQSATALANGVAARFGPIARQCQATSHSQADFVSCLKAHGVQISAPMGAQTNLDACLKQAQDATALGKCAKLVGAP